MNNTQKYASLVDYSILLNRSMRKFDTVFRSKPPKQMGSFNVTMSNVAAIIGNIKEIQKLRDEMRMLASLDEVAQKDNKSARKAGEKISSIKSELSQSYSRLKDDFFKQLKVAGKQCREVERATKDKEDRARFHGASRDFLLMVFEAETERFRIPLNETDELTQQKQDQAKREHQEQEEQLDNISEFTQQDTDKLGVALSTLTTILATTPTDDLSKEVRSEVAQIKKALPPKTIAIAKDSLERLRHSSHLVLDLEQISEIMQTTHRFRGSDGKLQKINKQLDALQPLLAQAIKEEQERNMEIKRERNAILGKVNYATDAVRTYGNILDGNVGLEQEQIRIGNNTHGLYAENARLREDEKKAYAEVQEIQKKSVDRQEWNDGLKVDQLYERAKHDMQAIHDNQEYMANKMSASPVTKLPPEYTDMKKRLQSISSLYQMQMTQSESENLSSESVKR